MPTSTVQTNYRHYCALAAVATLMACGGGGGGFIQTRRFSLEYAPVLAVFQMPRHAGSECAVGAPQATGRDGAAALRAHRRLPTSAMPHPVIARGCFSRQFRDRYVWSRESHSSPQCHEACRSRFLDIRLSRPRPEGGCGSSSRPCRTVVCAPSAWTG